MAAAVVLVPCESERHSRPYVEALRAVGIPEEAVVVVTPDSPAADRDPDLLERTAAGAAGVLLPGGPDIHPKHFGEEPLGGARLTLMPELDEIELAVLAGARRARTPVWAVCRGLQVLNVFLGGSLYQDLPIQHPGLVEHQLGYPRDALIHDVEILPSARGPLAEALGRDHRPQVNSRHHQALRDVAEGLEIVAVSEDGVIEAAALRREGGDDWWVDGVQWHPENLLPLTLQRALWQRFAREAAAHSRRSPEGPTLTLEVEHR